MSYEKQTWSDGDIITREKLNHMENGIANEFALVVYSSYDQTGKQVLSHTFAEIAPYLPFVVYSMGGDTDPKSGEECYYGFLNGSQGFEGSTYLEFIFPRADSDNFTMVFRGNDLNAPMYEDKD